MCVCVCGLWLCVMTFKIYAKKKAYSRSRRTSRSLAHTPNNTMEAFAWLGGVLNYSDLSVFRMVLNGDACILGSKSVGRKTNDQTLCVDAFSNACVCVWLRDSNTECQKLEVTATIARIIIIIKGTTRHNAHIKHKRENNLNRKPNKKSFCTVRACSTYGGLVC